jgi:hypothetical protein
MQGFMKIAKKVCTYTFICQPSQLSLDCFKTPFEQHLNIKNRWIALAALIPWDEICNLYLKHVGSQAKVEFGAKTHIPVIDGITFLDELSWDAFNEGGHMMD